MNVRNVPLVLFLALGLAACADHSTAPEPDVLSQNIVLQQQTDGTGLILESLTNVPLVGDVIINQAVITNLLPLEVAGQIVGVQAEGVLQLSSEALGLELVEEDFLTTVSVASSGRGQCSVLTIDLGQDEVSVIGGTTVDIPEASLNARASGAVGSLLCNLGQALAGIGGGLSGLLNAINRLI